MRTVTDDIHFIDLEHLGRRSVIGAALIDSQGMRMVVDPGPESTLPTLLGKLARRGIAVRDLNALLLTHVHLDHAGASGALVGANPALRVYVHQVGAPHLIDPSKLMASARRLWPDELDVLWGECRPVPAENLVQLTGGELIPAGACSLEVAATPGHASHHVCYFEPSSRTVFAGDTGGVRIAGTRYALAPTPPPDIDIAAWEQSLDRLAAWRPERIVATHFGASGAEDQLGQVRDRLQIWSEWARVLVDDPALSDEQRAARFIAQVEAEIRAHVGEELTAAILQASRPDLCWLGLARYWRRAVRR